MNLLEIRKKINDINSKYDEQVSELKLKIAEIENQRTEELGDLPAQYDATCSEIIDQYEAGTYVKQSGVSIRELTSVSIVDEKAVPENYLKQVVDDKKVKQDLKESGYTITIPGVVVSKKYSVAVTLK